MRSDAGEIGENKKDASSDNSLFNWIFSLITCLCPFGWEVQKKS